MNKTVTTVNKTIVDQVREFSAAMEIYMEDEPNLPEIGELSRRSLVRFYRVADELGYNLKQAAQNARERGDAAGALALIRLQLIQEELAELAEGLIESDIVAVFDALCDLDYVVTGTYLTYGLADHRDRGLAEVHRSNMSKLDVNGQPIIGPSGRVEKSMEYSPPDLKGVLKS